MKKQKPATALVLRCCNEDMSSQNGFVWPGVGEIATAADWRDDSECGHGLHGWLYGQGDHSSSNYSLDAKAKWLVVEVLFSDVRMLGGKCKFPSGKVVFVGEKSEAAAYIIEHEPQAKSVAVIGAILECGEGGSLLAGDLAVLTGGNYATMTGGDSATMTGGNYATMTGGNYATMTGGNYATMTGGDSATMTGGYSATMTGGDSATMTGGNYAVMHFTYWDGKRTRTVIAYVGEDGIEANVAYRLDDNHKLVKD